MAERYEAGYADGYEQGRDDMAVHLIWAVRAIYEATPHYPGMRMNKRSLWVKNFGEYSLDFEGPVRVSSWRVEFRDYRGCFGDFKWYLNGAEVDRGVRNFPELVDRVSFKWDKVCLEIPPGGNHEACIEFYYVECDNRFKRYEYKCLYSYRYGISAGLAREMPALCLSVNDHDVHLSQSMAAELGEQLIRFSREGWRMFEGDK